MIKDGTQLTAKNILEGRLSMSNPILVQDSPESIGMTVLKGSGGKPVNVRDIANIIGHAYPVSVIDVRHQEELEGWTVGDLTEYFEDEDRLRSTTKTTAAQHPTTTNNRRRRAAATEALQKQQRQLVPMVLNQISLEFSRTPLYEMVKSPQFVRDLDWIDHAWPFQRRKMYDYPIVQYYCLTSTAGCYTDFHCDFGGTAVWYHILRGEKTFALIAPTKENLVVYEDWLCRSDQSELFLPDLLENKQDVLTLSLKASQTLIIPTGWIHAVYTPEDSVVIGGNFLHGLDMSLQLEIHYLETRTRVPGRFRFPHFLPLMFYAGGVYLTKLQSNAFLCEQELEGLEDLISALEGWWKLQADETLVTAAKYAAETNGCESVEEFLTLLKLERARRLMKKEMDASEKQKLRLKLPPDAKPRVMLSPPRDSKPESVRIKLSPPRGDSKPATTDSMRLNFSPPHDTTKPASAGIRLKVKSPQETTNSASLDFRIVLPSNSRITALPKKRKSFEREGLEEYVPAEGDDDWEPEPPKKRGGTKAIPTSSRQRSKRMLQSKKPASTSRQRLMKRLR